MLRLLRGVRWALLFPAWIGAMVMSGSTWYGISRDLALQYCPPGRGGHYGASLDFACNWPLWVALLKDGLAAPLAAATIVALPTLVAPHRREAVAWIFAGLTLLLWLAFQGMHYRPGRHVASHQLLVLLAFVAGLAIVVRAFRRGPSWASRDVRT